MNKVLSKRIPREFKSNLPKYIALLDRMNIIAEDVG